jgi:hypothetical protein
MAGEAITTTRLHCQSHCSRPKSVLINPSFTFQILGFVATFLFYSVLPCVCLRTDDPKKAQHLLSLDGAKERLHLFKADLLEEGSFDPVVDGCHGVFHTASPVLQPSTDPQVRPIIYFMVNSNMFFCLLERVCFLFV